MAGLGRGLGSLISESNSKKARQQDQNAAPLGQDLLERSRASLPQAKESKAPSAKTTKKAKSSANKVASELKAEESSVDKATSSTKTKATSKAKSKSSTKSQAKASSKATATSPKDEPKEQAPAQAKEPKQASKASGTKAKRASKKQTHEIKTDSTQADSSTNSSSISEEPQAKKTRAKSSTAKSTSSKSAASKGSAKSEAKQGLEDSKDELLASESSILDSGESSEVSHLAKDAALAQSMQDAMELSYLAENGIQDSNQANDIELVSSVSDDHLVLSVKLDMLMPSTYQPRHSFDDEAIRELATSIKEHGLLEPLIVKRIEGGKYEIICGERRYRAARMLNMASVPCLVREVVDEKAYAIALIENIQRENLNPVELAIAFDQMMQECGMTQEEVAKSVCKSRSAVANYLRVLKLEDGCLAALKAGKIDLGHAKVLLSLSGSAQTEACQIVIEKGLSVRATESFVKEFAKKLEARAAEEAKNNPPSSLLDSNRTFNYLAYEKSLNTKLKGVKAKFKSSKDGKGKLTFSYDNEMQLESLLTLLGLVQED